MVIPMTAPPASPTLRYESAVDRGLGRGPRRARRAAWVVLLGVCLWPAALRGGAWPVPDEAAQSKALAAARETYRDHYAVAKTPAEKRALGEQLRQRGEEAEDRADRFILLKLSSDILAQSGEAAAALASIETLARSFAVDQPAMKLEVLQKMERTADAPKLHKAIADAAKSVLASAQDEDRYDLAGQVLELQLTAARAARDTALVKTLVSQKKEHEEAVAAFGGMKSAVAKLESNPIDPAANLQLGKFYCLVCGNWERGVPMLALGTDAALKAVAVRELQGAADAEAQAALADQWWDLADKEADAAKKRLRQRAGYWYRQALAGAADTQKARLEKRLMEADPTEAAALRKAKDKDKEEIMAAAAQQKARARAAKKPIAFTFTDEATIKKNWRLPQGDNEWQVTPEGLRIMHPRDAKAFESLFTIGGDCDITLAVSGRAFDPPSVLVFGETIKLPQPPVYNTPAKPYSWQVTIARRGPTLTAAVGATRIGNVTLKEASLTTPTTIGLECTREPPGTFILGITVRANEFNQPEQ